MPNFTVMPDGSLLINNLGESRDTIAELKSILDDVGIESKIVKQEKKNAFTVAQMKQILSTFDDDSTVSLFVNSDECGLWAAVKVGQNTIMEEKMEQ